MIKHFIKYIVTTGILIALSSVSVADDETGSCSGKPSGAKKLYRLYKKSPSDHLYTTSEIERDNAKIQGYVEEAVTGLVLHELAKGTTALYRLYSWLATDHFYTIDKRERDRLAGGDLWWRGYKSEGITGYVYTSVINDKCWKTKPLYRMYNALAGDHFYTSDPVEKHKAIKSNGYTGEGEAGYVIEQNETPRKNPIMIVGGTYAGELLYLLLEGRLKRDGYAYTFFELPEGGKIDIRESADYLKVAIDNFLRETGGSKIDIIAHSQGGIVTRVYINKYNGWDKIDDMISLAVPHKGTTFMEKDSFILRFLGCPSENSPSPCEQLATNSSLIQKLNDLHDSDTINYTNFITTNDIFVTPYMNGAMNNCSKNSTGGLSLSCNVVIQNHCSDNKVDHVGLIIDGAVYSGIKQAINNSPIKLNCRSANHIIMN